MDASQKLTDKQLHIFDKLAVDNVAVTTKAKEQPEFTEVVGIDFGKGAMWCHYLNGQKDAGPIPYREAIDYLTSERHAGCKMVAESAHAGNPRTINSLAQLFTEEELHRLRNSMPNGSALFLFPQSATRRAGRWVALNAPEGFVDIEKSTDINDARILAYYVGRKNDISLMKPVQSFDFADDRRYGRLVRRRSNGVLGPARTLGYDVGDLFPVTFSMAQRVHEELCRTVPLLGDGLSTALGVMSTIVMEKPAIFGDVCGGYEASVFTYKGKIPGWRFWKKNVLMMSPWHHRGGIFRSNLMHHRYRSLLRRAIWGEKAGRQKLVFGEFSADQEMKRRQVSRALRHDLKEAYLFAVSLVLEAGLPGHELLDGAR